jgi:hypothetical protein
MPDPTENQKPDTTLISPNKDFWRDSRVIMEDILSAYGSSQDSWDSNWGKIYDEDDVLKYWGQIRDNKANGYGKLLFATGVPEFEGIPLPQKIISPWAP